MSRLNSVWEARLAVEQTWDGAPAAPRECALLRLTHAGDALEIQVVAPFHADPPPPGPAGSLHGLWEYEVVELFLLGDREEYLEVELGPHGHYLALRLRGRRNIVRRDIALEHRATIEGSGEGARWTASARVPARWLPRGVHAANAYAIHGTGPERRYLAHRGAGGTAPDFHRLEHFVPFHLPPALASRARDLEGD